MANLKDMITEIRNDLNVIKEATCAKEDVNAEIVNKCWNEVNGKLDKIHELVK